VAEGQVNHGLLKSKLLSTLLSEDGQPILIALDDAVKKIPLPVI
jgi:hypothetical protein